MQGNTELPFLPSRDEADPLDIGERQRALISACYHGYHQVLERLVKAVTATGSEMELLDGMLLHQLTARHQDDVDPRVDRVRCLQQLLTCGLPVGVNAQDLDGNTPLHLAALHENQSLVAPLIEHGAIIGIKNNFGTMPIDDIKPKTMEAMLDRSVSKNDWPDNRDKFAISFHYSSMLPPTSGETVTAITETAPLLLMGKSQEHRELLNHPVIFSFITVKWLKMQPFYLLAVGLYAAFVAILTGYRYLKFHVAPESGEEHLSPLSIDRGLFAMKVALWTVLVVLVLRELLELSLSWRDYLRYPKNILQIVLIALLAVMLIGTMSEQMQLHIATWVTLIAWFEFVLLLGRHPKLCTYIMMFKITRVLMNMLIGLPVSDTELIRPELYSLVVRVSLIHNTEKAMLGVGDVRGGGCCGRKTNATCLYNARHWLARRVLLFPRCGEGEPRMTVRRNGDHFRLICCESHSFRVDNKVVKAAQKLLGHSTPYDDRLTVMDGKRNVMISV